MRATRAPRRFSVDEYYRMAETGILDPRERVELIEGEIVRMAAIGSRHAACVKRSIRFLVRAAGDRALVQAQDPVRLDDLSEPEPDLALLRPRADDYAAGHPGPGDVLLVVEVADTTGAYDREVKAPLYARAGVAEYWIVDLEQDRIEVHRQPEGGLYRERTTRARGDRIHPFALPEIEVPVDEVLP